MSLRDRVLVRLAASLLQCCSKPTRVRLVQALRPRPVPISDDEY